MEFGLQDEVAASFGPWISFDNFPALAKTYPELSRLVRERFLEDGRHPVRPKRKHLAKAHDVRVRGYPRAYHSPRNGGRIDRISCCCGRRRYFLAAKPAAPPKPTGVAASGRRSRAESSGQRRFSFCVSKLDPISSIRFRKQNVFMYRGSAFTCVCVSVQ